MLGNQGVSPEAIRKLMGHSEKTGFRILQRYLDASEKHLQDAVDRLPQNDSPVRTGTKSGTGDIAKKAENG